MQLLSLSIDTLDRPGQRGICPLAPIPHWVRALPGEMNDLYDADVSQYDISARTASCLSSSWHLVKIPALGKLTPIKKCLKDKASIHTLNTPRCLGWPFSSLLLFPPFFSLPRLAIHVRMSAWAFSICACFMWSSVLVGLFQWLLHRCRSSRQMLSNWYTLYSFPCLLPFCT